MNHWDKKHYLDTLVKARDLGYSIIPVKDYDKQKKVILLRHDIDFSLEYAYELANFEYDLGICSSYYVYLHSPTYSALSPKSMGMIRQMKGMGHEIGLHYDSRYVVPCEDLVIGPKIDSYTQHNPSMTEKTCPWNLTNPNDLPIKYISDSGRNWREGCMCKWIGKEDKLHILTHPEWWIGRGNSRDEIVYNMISDIKNGLDKERLDIVKQMKEYCRDLGIEY